MIQINLTEQEAVDMLSTVDSQIQMGEADQWEDSMLSSLQAVRDQLVVAGVRELPQMPGGLESYYPPSPLG